jgi:hypothetical protein
MSSKSFIFLPDISGFTNFVHATEVEHSQHIISELLELLIDHQSLNLTLAEIEGDALFYFRDGSVPSATELLEQVERMFIAFHTHLKQYELRRICNCGACTTANQLTLKFIAHAGPLDFIQIKDQRKPYGATVIAAHRLMKNTIPIDDYLLLSEGLYASWNEAPQSNLPIHQSESIYDLGTVRYQYYELLPLHKKVKTNPLPQIPIPKVSPLVSMSTNIEVPPSTAFDYILNFDYRKAWNRQVDKFEYDANRVVRVGTKHQCIINGSVVELESLADSSDQQKLIYGERTEDVPILSPFISLYIVEGNKDGAQITLQAITENNSLLVKILKPLIRFRMRKLFKETLANFKHFAESKSSHRKSLSTN